MYPLLLPLFVATAAAVASAPITTTAAPSTTPEHVLPMWMQVMHPGVAVHLDGHAEPLRFVVDSAAGATLVDSRIVRRFGLEDTLDQSIGQISGASASSATTHRMRQTDWAIGNVELKIIGLHTDLSSLSDPEKAVTVDGILGNDITRRWDTRWDFVAGQLQLWTPGHLPDGAHCQANALPTRQPGLEGFGFITVRLGDAGVEAVAVVDTGAAQTVLNAAAARALGLRTDGTDARVTPREKGTEGLGGKPHPSWLYTLPALGSGTWQHPALEVRISALPVFKVIGLEDQPALILGADAMVGGQVDISAGAARICLQRQAGSGRI
ncbi:aspartyl protease family protein [Bacillus subtilis subsp. subtilis]|nr:aspartyl protease family protein [Bacillus subtilis subsp. subtilis]